jgi:hypothetical protein
MHRYNILNHSLRLSILRRSAIQTSGFVIVPYAAIAPFTDLPKRVHRLPIAMLHVLLLVALLSAQHFRPVGLAVQRSVSDHRATRTTFARYFLTSQLGVISSD